MDIFEKELAIADATYEAAVNRIVSMDSIESMYMTEASGDGDSFFKKLIQAIKDFFKKIKDAINKKITSMKADHAIKKINKMQVKVIKGVKSYSDFEKVCKKYSKDIIAAFSDDIKGIYSAMNVSDIDKYYDDFSSVCDDFFDDFEDGLRNIPESKNAVVDVKKFYDVSCDDIENTTDTAISKLDDIDRKLEKEKEKSDDSSLINAKQSAVKKTGTKLTSVFKKIGNAMSRHKIATFTAVCTAAAAGSYVGGKAISKAMDNRERKRINKEVDPIYDILKTESVDDLLDDMISDLSGEYDSVTESYDDLPVTLEECIMEAGALQKYIKTKEDSLKADKEKLARLKKQVDKMSGEAYKKGKEKVDALQRKISEGETIPGNSTTFSSYKDKVRRTIDPEENNYYYRKEVKADRDAFKQATGGPTRRDPHDRAAGDRGHKTIPDKLKNINDKKRKQAESED